MKEGQIKAADVERWKWEAFWDAPLYVEGSGVRPPTHATSIPPMNGIFSQKGLPRTPDEINRSTASYQATTLRGEEQRRAPRDHASPASTAGRLRRPAAVRRVQGHEPDSPGGDRQDRAAVGGVQVRRRPEGAADPGRLRASVWRDLSGRWQDQQFGGPVNKDPATVWSSNRLIAAELPGGSIAAFPPPHSFFWRARIEPDPRRHLVPQGQRLVVLVRDPAGREGRGPGVPAQLRALPARGPAPGSRCRSSSTSARTARRPRSTRRSPSRAATASSRSPATR